jgi:hypothetical protein
MMDSGVNLKRFPLFCHVFKWDRKRGFCAHFWERFMWVRLDMYLWVKCCGKDKDG